MSNIRVEDRRMVAASETAQRNPMRPPDTLPRDRAAALRQFCSHSSPRIIAAFVLLFGAWRIALGDFGWVDAAIALGVLAYFPVNEWLIHVVMLHYKPRTVFGRTIDFYLPVTHRRHHADPWNPKWVFIPRHVHLLVLPTIGLLLWALWPWKAWALTGVTAYLLLGLHYDPAVTPWTMLAISRCARP